MTWLIIALLVIPVFVYLMDFAVETGFVYVMTLQQALEEGLWVPSDMKRKAYFWLAVGTPGDIVFNTWRGSRVFKERPRWWKYKEFMFSSRVQRWVDAGAYTGGWRYDEAVKWATLLNFIKPGHIKRV